MQREPAGKSAAAARPVAETLLRDYATRLVRTRAGRRAIHLHLSRLKPYNRRGHHLRIAGSVLAPLVQRYDGALFSLFNDDVVVVCNGASVADMDDYVVRLRFLFSEDPLLHDEDSGDREFCSWYDLAADYGQFMRLAESLVETRQRVEAERAAALLAAARIVDPDTAPIDPSRLGAVESAIARADLSHMLHRQPICALGRGNELKPLLHEIYISIDELSNALLPQYNFTANPWLFLDLTRHLDRRMMSLLTHNDDTTLNQSISLNFNVATLLTPEFLALDAVINNRTPRTIVIELQLLDIFADLPGFAFARDFLRDRGYRICLDGATHHSLPFIGRHELGVDLVKLRWSGELPDYATGTRGDGLRRAVEALSPERLILCRCDSTEALEVGRGLDVTLYQGRLLDGMLSKTPATPGEVRQRMALSPQ